MAATRSPLRRWERFFPAFAAIDGAIEDAAGHPRGEFRSVRARIVTLLRAARDDVAEELCAALDAAMEEALATLRVAAVTASAPPESAGLAESVIALSEHHESARVRGLAGDVVRRWTAAAEAALVGAKRFMEVINKHTKEPRILPGSAVNVAERAGGRGCDARDAADQDKERYAPPAKTKMAINAANGSVAVKVAAPLLNKQSNGKMEEKAQAPAGGNRVQTSEEMMMVMASNQAQASRGLPTGGGCEESTEDSGHRGRGTEEDVGAEAEEDASNLAGEKQGEICVFLGCVCDC